MHKIVFVCLVTLGLTALQACSVTKGLRTVTLSSPMYEYALKEIFGTNPAFAMEWADGGTGTLTFQAGNKVTVTAGSFSDNGNWHTEGEQLCMTFTKTYGGEKTCYIIRKKWSDRYKFYNDQGQFYAYGKVS